MQRLLLDLVNDFESTKFVGLFVVVPADLLSQNEGGRHAHGSYYGLFSPFDARILLRGSHWPGQGGKSHIGKSLPRQMYYKGKWKTANVTKI